MSDVRTATVQALRIRFNSETPLPLVDTSSLIGALATIEKMVRGAPNVIGVRSRVEFGIAQIQVGSLELIVTTAAGVVGGLAALYALLEKIRDWPARRAQAMAEAQQAQANARKAEVEARKAERDEYADVEARLLFDRDEEVELLVAEANRELQHSGIDERLEIEADPPGDRRRQNGAVRFLIRRIVEVEQVDYP
jgi:hypothetical protein